MEDYGWCPNSECQGPAEIDKVKLFGQCINCGFKFCSSCRKKYHPFKRCDLTKVELDTDIPKDKLINLQNEAKSLLYLKFCSKPCPSCNYPI